MKTVAFDENLLEPIENYKLDEEALELLRELEVKCSQLMIKKDRDYGGSWQKRGIMSVNENSARKWDRLQNLFKNGFSIEVKDETVLDTLMDLRNYVSLYIYFMLTKNPELLKQFKTI